MPYQLMVILYSGNRGASIIKVIPKGKQQVSGMNPRYVGSCPKKVSKAAGSFYVQSWCVIISIMNNETDNKEKMQKATDIVTPDPETNGKDGSGLNQEQFEAFLKKFGFDGMDEMLKQAGLSGEDAEQAGLSGEDAELAEPLADDADSQASGAVEEPAAAADTGLTPEKIARLLKALGDDVINDMLEDAGLTEKDADAAAEDDGEAVSRAEAASPDDAAEVAKAGSSEDKEPADEAKSDDAGEAGKGSGEKAESNAGSKDVKSAGSEKKPRRKGKTKRRLLFAAVFAGIILMLFAVNKIYMSATLNSDDPIQYSERTDEISAQQGLLEVNDVEVTVPSDGNEEYSISYSWAEDDEQYPSVPHAVTAIYSGKEGNKLYSITLYRNETVPKKDVPAGKTPANWFESWKPGNDEGVLEERRRSGDFDGFYIYPKPAEEGEEQEYNDYSYYFAVEDNGGISTYVIEGICLDPAYAEGFPGIMDGCIKSISLKGSGTEDADTGTDTETGSGDADADAAEQ